MYPYEMPDGASYKQNWLGIMFQKRRAHLFFDKASPSEIVQHILTRATKYKGLTFEQIRVIADKASEKYSGSPHRTLSAVCPWEYRKLTMFRGKWDLTEIDKRSEAEDRQKKVKRDCELAFFECINAEIPYCRWPKESEYDCSFWEKSFETLIDEQEFLKRELPDDVSNSTLTDKKGVKRVTPIYVCESCKRIGGRKKVRFYGFKKNTWNFGCYCVSCWNRLRPIWKVESEWKDIKTLANKLEREAK